MAAAVPYFGESEQVWQVIQDGKQQRRPLVTAAAARRVTQTAGTCCRYSTGHVSRLIFAQDVIRERPDAGRVRPEPDRTGRPVRQATSVKGPDRTGTSGRKFRPDDVRDVRPELPGVGE